MEKYYTPSLEEFHFGFECEMFNGNEWGFCKIDCLYEFDNIADDIESENVRVKYLDSEDITSLGWIPCESGFHGISEDNSFTFERYEYNNYSMIFCSDYVVVIKKHEDKFFEGTIKNKSELKKLLNQLGI